MQCLKDTEKISGVGGEIIYYRNQKLEEFTWVAIDENLEFIWPQTEDLIFLRAYIE